MASLTRFGISIDTELLQKFDASIETKGYDNRSEAIRDLIRNTMVEEEWLDGEREAVGTITLVFDHHTRNLSDKLTEHQHSHHHAIVSSLHVHLDEVNCLEVIVLRGKTEDIRKLSSELIGTKGVKHGKLVMTTTGSDLT